VWHYRIRGLLRHGYEHHSGVSNGGTEAVNSLIEKARRLAHGYRNHA
jgi:transposase